MMKRPPLLLYKFYGLNRKSRKLSKRVFSAIVAIPGKSLSGLFAQIHLIISILFLAWLASANRISQDFLRDNSVVTSTGKDLKLSGKTQKDREQTKKIKKNSGGSTGIINRGSFVIDMGATVQTTENGLKPYGLVYDLLKNAQTPVIWIINPDKAKDGTDFTLNGKNYRGGPFAISAKYRNSQVDSIVANWALKGVLIDEITSDVSVPIFDTLSWVPSWTLDAQNGSIAETYLINAGIPGSAYNWRLPSELNCCDDVYVMPHADPVWSTHGNLLAWNQSCKGSIWAACHAVSALENMFNPAFPAQQTNFLSNKIANASGPGPWAENALVLWTNHGAGTIPPPYMNSSPGAPVMQFIGPLDGALENGSEQIYLPVLGSSWRNTTSITVWDADHPDIPSKSPGLAVKVAYGNAFGDPNRGLIMYEAGHTHAPKAKKGIAPPSSPQEVAAQRAFFNFSWLSSGVNAIQVSTAIPPLLPGGIAVQLNSSVSGGSGVYNYAWTSSCGGTFDNPNIPNPVFTPDEVTDPTLCQIKLVVTDNCGNRLGFNNSSITVAKGTSEAFPVCVSDTIITPPCQSASVFPLLNDADANFDPLNVSIIGSGVTNLGNFQLNPNGSIQFDPLDNVEGVTSISYAVCDNKGNCDTCSVVAIVGVSNPGPPAPVRDNISMCEDNFVTFNPLANDTDPNNLTLHIQSIPVNGINGKAFINESGTISYVPNKDFSGLDSIKYRVCNSNQLCETQTILITIADDSCPAGQYKDCNSNSICGQSALNASGTTTPGNATSSADLSFANIDVNNGNFTLDMGQIIAAGQTIRIYAGANVSNRVLRVSSSLDNISFGNSTDYTSFSSGAIGSPPANTDTLSYTVPTGGIQYLKFAKTSSGGTIYVDAACFIAEASCSSIPNRIPYAVADQFELSCNQNIALDLLENDVEPDGESMSIALVAIMGTQGTINLIGDSLVNYEAANQFTGLDSFAYATIDQSGNRDTARVFITISNCSPIANSDSLSVNYQTAGSIHVLSNDYDPDTLILSISNDLLPTRGSIALVSSDTIQYIPEQGFTGVDSFFYIIADGPRGAMGCETPDVLRDTGKVFVNVINQAPTAQPIFRITNFCESKNISVYDSISDPENGTMTVRQIISGPFDGTASINVDSLSIFYDPNLGVINDPDTIMYIVCDNGSPSKCDTGLIVMDFYPLPTNNKPVGLADYDTTIQNQTYYTQILANDYDPDNNPIFPLLDPLLLMPTNGMAEIQPNGLLKYIPNPEFVGIDSFEYRLRDTVILSGTILDGCVTIPGEDTLVKVYFFVENQAPLAQDDYDTTYVNTSKNIAVLTSDFDPDSDTLMITNAAGNENFGNLFQSSRGGNAVIHSNGTPGDYTDDYVMYTPPALYIGLDTFFYSVCDDVESPYTLCDTAQVIIFVNENPESPSVELVKSSQSLMDHNEDGYIGAGDTIFYNFTIHNTGNVALTNVILTDSQVSLLGCPSESLSVGDSMICTAIHIISQIDIDAGEHVNSAIVGATSPLNAIVKDTSDTGNPGDPRQTSSTKDSTTTALTEYPLIELFKGSVTPIENNGDGIFGAGDSLYYTFRIYNRGNIIINDIVLSDDHAFVSCPSNTLGAGDSMTCTGYYLISENDMLNKIILNRAYVTGKSGSGTEVRDTSDSINPGDDRGTSSDTTRTRLIIPDIRLTKSITALSSMPIDDHLQRFGVGFEMIMKSVGEDTLESVQLIDSLLRWLGPVFIGIVPGSLTISAQKSQVAASINPSFNGISELKIFQQEPVLAKGDSVKIAVTVIIDLSHMQSLDTLKNQALVSAFGVLTKGQVRDRSDAAAKDKPETEGTNPEGPGDTGGSDDPTRIIIPNINLTKRIINISNPSLSGHEDHIDIEYEFILKNTGNDTIQDIQLVDELKAQLGNAFVRIIQEPEIISQNGIIPAMINPIYNGDDQFEFFSTRPVFAPGDSIKLRLLVETKPLQNEGLIYLVNQALVIGQDLHSNLAMDLAEQELMNYNSGTLSYSPAFDFNVADLSDSGTNPLSYNTDSPDDNISEDDPTQARIPLVSLAKRIVGSQLAASGVVGNFDVTYEFVYKNVGNVDLKNIQIKDDIKLQMHDAFVRVIPLAELSGIPSNPWIVSSQASTDPVISTKYLGEMPFDQMFESNSGLLEVDSQMVIRLIIEVNPNANTPVDTLFNQARAYGTGNNEDEFLASDLSDNGSNPDTKNEDYDQSSTKSDPTPLILADLNLAKQVTFIKPARSSIVGNVEIGFEYKFKNKGNENINSIHLFDDIQSQIGKAFVRIIPSGSLGHPNPEIIASSAFVTPTANAIYSGDFSNFDLLSGDGIMRPNDTVIVRLIVEVDPNAVDADQDGMADILFNQAKVTGVDPRGMTLMDLSDSGSSTDSSNPGEPNDSGGMDDPTPVEIPLIHVTKVVANYSPPSSGTEGNIDVIFNLRIQNTGNVRLKNIQMRDTMDLPAHLGMAYVGLSSGSQLEIIESNAQTIPVINNNYDGRSSGDARMFNGSSGILYPGEYILLKVIAEIDPGLAEDPESLWNQAFASGLGISQFPKNNGPGGIATDRILAVVDDGSDNGNIPESNNDDDNNNTRTKITPCLSGGKVICYANVNISLDGNCVSEVLPSMLSPEISAVCNSYYRVELYDEHNKLIPGNRLSSLQLNKTIIFKIYEPENGQYCWGNLLVEDKQAPQLVCRDDTLSCIEFFEFTGPEVLGECFPPEISVVDEGFVEICGDPYVKGYYKRSYIARDASGNKSNGCSQRIFIKRANFDTLLKKNLVLIPKDIVLSCDQAGLYDEQGNVRYSLSGVPTWNGSSLLNKELWTTCNIAVDFKDEIIFQTGCKTKILRTWKFREWVCDAESKEINRTQFITIIDTIAPEIEIGFDTLIATNGNGECGAFVKLPQAKLSDNCHTTTVEIFYPGGVLMSNGGIVELDYGIHTLIYKAYDECHNSSLDTLVVHVLDKTPPVPICIKYLTVSVEDTIVRVEANRFDNGSYDHCKLKSMLVRRMDNSCDSSELSFGPFVSFCCSDAGKDIPVVFRLIDESGNWSECMVLVNVQDKSPVSLECLPDITVSCGFAFADSSVFGSLGTNLQREEIVIGDEYFISSTGPMLDGIYFDNCGVSVKELPLLDKRDQCGIGIVQRSFVLSETSGKQSNCIQLIHFVADHHKNMLKWKNFPPDVNIEACVGNASVLPDITGEPLVEYSGCAQVGTSWEDEVFKSQFSNPYCIVIARRWQVIDWCKSGIPILLDSIQYIHVKDNTPPQFVDGCNNIVQNTNQFCGSRSVLLTNRIEDCVPNKELKWEYQLTTSGGNLVSAGEPDKNDEIVYVQLNLDTGNYLLTWSVEDLCGNSNSCTQPVRISCNPKTFFTVEGSVISRMGGAMDQVDVYLNDTDEPGASLVTRSSSTGKYNFGSMPGGGSYVVAPEKRDDILNGVSTLDLIILQKHVLGIEILKDPLTLIAADINKDGRISSLDLVELKRVLLGLQSEFTNNTSWQFIWDGENLNPEDFDLAKARTEQYHITSLQGDMILKFIAVKTGDLDGNATSGSISAARNGHDRKEEVWKYQFSEVNGRTELQLRSTRALRIAGFQLNWLFETSNTYIEALYSDIFDLNDRDYHFMQEDKFRMNFAAKRSKYVKKDELLFTVRFDRILQNPDLELNLSGILNELYTDEGAFVLELQKIENEPTGLVVSQNIPNPWSEATELRYSLPEDGNIEFTVFDMLNRLVHKRTVIGRKGKNSMVLQKENIPYPGVYMIQVRFRNEVYRSQMIQIR